ncbi:TY-Chap domain-containing protein [Nocardia acidivorans]|uniref:TY-Chap domain-containing protein n=1 Tax=Nocardia acidivorans TaxID=404580 RepID=UPI0008354957|nr:hypothetical protein [Nocardia acidivorans]
MGSGIFEDRARAEQLAAESEVWEWFSAALGWTLFALPVESYLVLSAPDGLSAQFIRGSDSLYCEVVADRPEDAAAARLRAQGWDAPGPLTPDNWRRELAWPARFSDYTEIAAQVVAVMRDVQGLWLPMELTARTWTDGSEVDPALKALELGRHSADNLRALASWALADLARRCRRTLDSEMRAALRGHEIRMFLARDLMASRDAEILAGGDDAWPVRDRTADCVGLVGPGHLLMVDVVLDVDDPADLRLDCRIVDGLLVERGSDPFVRAMVHADPDLRAALADRPELAAALERDELWIEYKLIARDSAQRLTLSHVRTEDRRPASSAVAAQDTNDSARQTVSPPPTVAPDRGLAVPGQSHDPLADVYPLLKPSGWPVARWAPHSRFGTEHDYVLIVFAHDRPSTYEVITVDNPEAHSSELGDRAYANLAALHYEWRVVDAPGLTLATLSGFTFSSEKLLDAVAMREAQRLLGTNEIVVSVPRRTCLYAFARNALDSVDSLRQVQRLVEGVWADDSGRDAQITRLLFAFRDGAPVGVLNMDDQAPSRRRYRAR